MLSVCKFSDKLCLINNIYNIYYISIQYLISILPFSNRSFERQAKARSRKQLKPGLQSRCELSQVLFKCFMCQVFYIARVYVQKHVLHSRRLLSFKASSTLLSLLGKASNLQYVSIQTIVLGIGNFPFSTITGISMIIYPFNAFFQISIASKYNEIVTIFKIRPQKYLSELK